MRKLLVAGNWKMNGSIAMAQNLLADLVAAGVDASSEAEWLVCPPFPYLSLAQEMLQGTIIKYGAQNLSSHEQGAYTGEVSGAMLNDFNCEYVIVGHSERRSYYSENNAVVAEKFARAMSAGLKPILCVGETLEQYDSGITLEIVQEQLADILNMKDNFAGFAEAVIAYEPVWAIGTGKTATPEQAQAVHAAIREQLASCSSELADKMRILYGGSVKPNNARDLFMMPDIDGALVGGASLKAEQFLQIGLSCNK